MTVTADRSFVAHQQLIVDTYVVMQRDKSYHYELHLSPDAEPNAPRTVLRTHDESAHDLALLVEGNGARVTATWHHARLGSHRFNVLDSLEVGV